MRPGPGHHADPHRAAGTIWCGGAGPTSPRHAQCQPGSRRKPWQPREMPAGAEVSTSCDPAWLCHAGLRVFTCTTLKMVPKTAQAAPAADQLGCGQEQGQAASPAMDGGP